MVDNSLVVDSSFEPKDVVIQNPDKPCPSDLFRSLGLMEVKYYGFDNQVHSGQIIVATKVMSEVEAFFQYALELKFYIECVVPVSAPQYRWSAEKVLKDNVSSGFDYRPVHTTDKKSLHSYGLAFDINPRQNPYIRYKNGKRILEAPKNPARDPSKPGTLHAEHPLVKMMEGFGWEWGGHWTPESGRTDYQHFQKPL